MKCIVRYQFKQESPISYMRIKSYKSNETSKNCTKIQ